MNTALQQRLTSARATIVDRWRRLVFETYPVDTADFLSAQKNPFANPVGHTISTSLERLFDALLAPGELDAARLASLLDPIVRIRAIQEFTPSQAVGFVPLLKDAARAELLPSPGDPPARQLAEGWLAFESRIDRLSLLAFDVYMNCRDRLQEIRSREQAGRRHVSAGAAAQCCESGTDAAVAMTCCPSCGPNGGNVR